MRPDNDDLQTGVNWLEAWLTRARALFVLPQGDLLREPVYRRLWLSILISSFGNQITTLALPLTAAVMLNASARQMGFLVALEILPFVLFSLPSGVWLDRVRKLPVYIGGELLIALVLISVPVVWALGALSMVYLYVVGFALGCVFVTAGTASQIVLTQVVPRSRLVEAHARNALASSSSEVAGPGLAGILIKLVGAPFALLADAVLLLISVFMLRGVKIEEKRTASAEPHFWRDLKEGIHFVTSQRLLLALALVVGLWQLCHNSAMVVQILMATRVLALSERAVGLCYIAVGVGTLAASVFGNRISRAFGPGPSLLFGVAINGVGWVVLALTPTGAFGVLAFVVMLALFGFGAVLIFINFLAIRQSVTPEPLLGRMTSTMRWLILLPAMPGALIGGYLGEHMGLRYALALGGVGALCLAVWGWRQPLLRNLRHLPMQVVSVDGVVPAASPPTDAKTSGA